MPDHALEEELRRLLILVRPDGSPRPNEEDVEGLRALLLERELAPEEAELLEEAAAENAADRPALERLLELRVRRALAALQELTPDSGMTVPRLTVLRGAPKVEETLERDGGDEALAERTEARVGRTEEQGTAEELDVALTDERLAGTLAQSVGVNLDAAEPGDLGGLPKEGGLVLTDDRAEAALERSLPAGAATFHSAEAAPVAPSGPTIGPLQVMNVTSALGEIERVLLWSVPAEQRFNLLNKARRFELVGEVLGGKYRIEERLGQGGFGTVYRARDVILDTDVAIKVLNPRFAKKASALESFLGEAQKLTTVDHPNIVRWITFDRTPDGLHYFVMEYLRGEELTEVLEDAGRLEPKRAADLMFQVLSALRRAHRADAGGSLLHLDLKPQNVFVVHPGPNEPERAKVIDFGISRFTTESGAAEAPTAGRGDLGATSQRLGQTPRSGTVRRAAGGTVLYASPEQCKHIYGDEDIEELDGRTDLYSLGVMGFQMLTGQYPFPEPKTHLEAIRNHVSVAPFRVQAVAKDVPRDLAAFVDKCLIKDRDKRWESTDQAYEALDRIVHPQVSRVKVLAMVAALLALTGFVTWRFAPRGEAPVEVAAADAFPAHGGGDLLVEVGGSRPLELRFGPGDAGLEPTDEPPRLVDDDGVPVDSGFRVSRVPGGFDVFCDSLAGLTDTQRTPTLEWDTATGVARLEEELVPVTAPAPIPLENLSLALSREVVTAADWRAGAPFLQRDAVLRLDLDGWKYLRQEEPVTLYFDGEPKGFEPTGGGEFALALDRVGASGRGEAYVEAIDVFGRSTTSDRFELDLVDRRSALERGENRVRWVPDGGQPVEAWPDPDDPRNYWIQHEPDGTGRLVLEVGLLTRGLPRVSLAGLGGEPLVWETPESARGDSSTRARFEADLDAEQRLAHLDLAVSASDEGWLLANWEDAKEWYDDPASRDSIRIDFIEDFDLRARLVDVNGSAATTSFAGDDEVYVRPGTYGLVLVPHDPVRNHDWAVRTTVAGEQVGAKGVQPREFELHPEVAQLDLGAAAEVSIELYPEQLLPAGFDPAADGAFEGLEPAQVLRFQAVTAASLELGTVVERLPIVNGLWDADAEPARSEALLTGLRPLSSAPLVGTVEVVATRNGAELHGDALALPAEPTYAQLFGEAPLADGVHGLALAFRDAAGNRATWSREFTVNAAGPAIGDLNLLLVEQSWVATDGTFKLGVRVTDGNGVDSVLAEIGLEDPSQPRTTQELDRSGDIWSCSVLGDLTWEGERLTIAIRARDALGQETSRSFGDISVAHVPRLYPPRLVPREGPDATEMVLLRIPEEARVYTFSEYRLTGDPRFEQALRAREAHYTKPEDFVQREASWFGVEATEVTTDARGTGDDPEALRPFYLDAHEVSCEQFLAFLDADDGYRARAGAWAPDPKELADRMAVLRRRFGEECRPEWPAIGVTWDEADAYARWAGKRLPTLLEWEYAVRGEEGRLFAFEADPETLPEVPVETYLGPNRTETIQVKVYAAVGLDEPMGVADGPFRSPDEIYHLCGNAAEWTSTPYLNMSSLRSEEQRRTWLIDPEAATDPRAHRQYWVAGRDYSFDETTSVGASYLPPYDFKAVRTLDHDFGSKRTIEPRGRLPLVGFRCALDAEEALTR